MWENLCSLREIFYSSETDFYILGLDQKKASDYLSPTEKNHLPNDFVKMVQLLCVKSTVWVDVNSV